MNLFNDTLKITQKGTKVGKVSTQGRKYPTTKMSSMKKTQAFNHEKSFK